MKRMLTAREAGRAVCRSPQWIRRLVHAGKIPLAGATGDGGAMLVWEHDVFAFARNSMPQFARNIPKRRRAMEEVAS